MTRQSVYNVDCESQALQLAHRNAQNTFKFFWRELSWERRRIVPALDFSAVKIAFAVSPLSETKPAHENMWVSDIEFDGETIKGLLMNTPQWVSTLQCGDAIEAPLSDLDDWMYVSNDVVFGGFTVDAIRASLSEAERSAHDEAWGLDFGVAGDVLVLAPTDAGPQGPVAELERQEHPMSESTAEMFEQFLREAPSNVSDVDAQGWQMLHREALAGNYAPVVALLKQGANTQAVTSQGMTALQLAQRIGWPRIVNLLETASR